MWETWVQSLIGKIPGEAKGYLLQYSGLENFMDCTVHGVTKVRCGHHLGACYKCRCQASAQTYWKNHQSNQMPGWFTCMLTFEKCYVEAPPFSEAANPGHSKERNPHGLGNLPIPGRLLPIRRKNGYPQTCLHRDIHWGLMKIFPTGYGLWCCYTSWLD